MEDGRVNLVAEFQAVVLLSCKSRKILDLEGRSLRKQMNQQSNIGLVSFIGLNLSEELELILQFEMVQ